MNELADEYRRRFETVLIRIARDLETHVRELLSGEPRVDRVTARAKSVDRFLAKAEAIEGGKKKYSEPLVQIQDQLGARIITFYQSDLDKVEKTILKYFRPISRKS